MNVHRWSTYKWPLSEVKPATFLLSANDFCTLLSTFHKGVGWDWRLVAIWIQSICSWSLRWFTLWQDALSCWKLVMFTKGRTGSPRVSRVSMTFLTRDQEGSKFPMKLYRCSQEVINRLVSVYFVMLCGKVHYGVLDTCSVSLFFAKNTFQDVTIFSWWQSFGHRHKWLLARWNYNCRQTV